MPSSGTMRVCLCVLCLSYVCVRESVNGQILAELCFSQLRHQPVLTCHKHTHTDTHIHTHTHTQTHTRLQHGQFGCVNLYSQSRNLIVQNFHFNFVDKIYWSRGDSICQKFFLIFTSWVSIVLLCI